MSELTYTPRRVEWRAPEGWTVWADEDGVHVKSVRGDSLEQPDVLNLIALYQAVREQVATHNVLAPKPPTREQVLATDAEYRAETSARVAMRAVREAFLPTSAVPF